MNNYYIKEKGKIIGKAKLYTMELTMLIGASIALTNLTGCGKQNQDNNISIEINYDSSEIVDEDVKELMEKVNYGKNITNHEVEEEIKPNIIKGHPVNIMVDSYTDTLSSIIYKYITNDASKVKYYEEKIVELNDLESPSAIQKGQTLVIPDVKEQYLKELGYTMNYDILSTNVELEDRMNFLTEHEKVLSFILLSDSATEEYKLQIHDVLEQIIELEKKYKTCDEEKYNDCLDEAKYICNELNKVYGDDFEEYKPAHEIETLGKTK